MVPESRRINFMAKPERKQLKNNPREKHNRPNPHTFFTASPPNSFFSTGYAERRQSVRPGFLYFYIFCDFHESRMYFRVSFSAEKETGLDSSSERIPFRSIPLARDIRSIPFVLPLPTKAVLLRGPRGRSMVGWW